MQKKLKYISLALLGLSLFFSACIPNPGVDEYEVLEKTEINPAFEQRPPIAKRVAFKFLEEPMSRGENLIYFADFDPNEVGSEFLAVNLGTGKVVLRDDGRGADEKADDGRYSLAMKTDREKFLLLLNQRQERRLDSNLVGSRQLVFKQRQANFLDVSDLTPVNLDLELGERVVELELAPWVWETFVEAAMLTKMKTHSLMITDTDVVEDKTRTFNPCPNVVNPGNPHGAWTFGTLMRHLATTNPSALNAENQASAFARNWLQSWVTTATVNGEQIPARQQIIDRILIPWENASAGEGVPDGFLDMRKAPFKLLAIVNRLDLRGNIGYGNSDAGEGRFVFCAIDLNTCQPLEFTVIFEYGINKTNCSDIVAFANEWKDLKDHDFATEEYRNRLQAITDQFALSGTNPNKPNNSSLNQLRTNEIVLGSPWELREWNLNASGQLELVTVKQEPAVKYNAKNSANEHTLRLAEYINSNSAAVEGGSHVVPEEFQGHKFLGGKAHTFHPPVGPLPVHHWDGDPTPGSPGFVVNNTARHLFSLNTCSGCHGGETQTSFTHIDPVGFGEEATLSGFLTGFPGSDFQGTDPLDIDGLNNGIMTVPDAGGRTPQWKFADLDRRAKDLEKLATRACLAPQDPLEPLQLQWYFDPIGPIILSELLMNEVPLQATH